MSDPMEFWVKRDVSKRVKEVFMKAGNFADERVLGALAEMLESPKWTMIFVREDGERLKMSAHGTMSRPELLEVMPLIVDELNAKYSPESDDNA